MEYPGHKMGGNVVKVRKCGASPFRVAVIHGGPGAGGEMAPVARELASDCGVLEPIQTATTLTGQIEELKTILEAHGDPPVVLVGFSWGAWLSFIFAARYPELVKKLILVGSGPFQEKYVARLHETRLERLSEEEGREFEVIVDALSDPGTEEKDQLLERLGALATKSDSCDPIAGQDQRSDHLGPQADVFRGVWREAAELRRSGVLLQIGRHIQCPVVAIHGDYDPHPAEGVRRPLSATLQDFRFILLENCGHKPWIERRARGTFYHRLKQETLNLNGSCESVSRADL
jgi:pimeloyl-ACP methyl ester carboxylesterase